MFFKTKRTGRILFVSLFLAACATATPGPPGSGPETASPQTPPPAVTESTLAPLTETPPHPSATPTQAIEEATGTPQAPQDQFPEAVRAAMGNMSQTFGIPLDQIQVVSFEEEQWPDSCLGLADPGEMCLQVITPGYRVILSAGGQQYEYHTDLTGQRLRFRPAVIP